MKNKNIRAISLWISGILLFIIVMLLIGYIYEPIAEKADSKSYPPPGKMVDIGGYRLHINCSGTGNPTVIIEAGLGDWSSIWKNVQDKLAKGTRVCTYDRAGMGWSDAGPKPRNAKQFSKELHTLLNNIQKPYVLAGHSLGGFTVRVYAHDYPEEISGIVLIDSMSPKQFPSSAINSHNNNASQDYTLYLLARFGIIRTFINLMGMMQNITPEEKSNNAHFANPTNLLTFTDENIGLPESAFQASQVKSFGDIPLIVLSAGLENTTYKSWNEWQNELLRLSSRSKHLTAQKSGHNIELEQPGAAVDAINLMVKQVRKKSSSL